MRLPGDSENAGTFLAHSFVFCASAVLNAFEDKVSSRGDVVEEPITPSDASLLSGDCRPEIVEADEAFVVSLITQISYLLAAQHNVDHKGTRLTESQG